MSQQTESLREIAIELTGDGMVTESQEESPSHDPIGEEESRISEEASEGATEDGLEDAVAGSDSAIG